MSWVLVTVLHHFPVQELLSPTTTFYSTENSTKTQTLWLWHCTSLPSCFYISEFYTNNTSLKGEDRCLERTEKTGTPKDTWLDLRTSKEVHGKQVIVLMMTDIIHSHTEDTWLPSRGHVCQQQSSHILLPSNSEASVKRSYVCLHAVSPVSHCVARVALIGEWNGIHFQTFSNEFVNSHWVQ